MPRSLAHSGNCIAIGTLGCTRGRERWSACSLSCMKEHAACRREVARRARTSQGKLKNSSTSAKMSSDAFVSEVRMNSLSRSSLSPSSAELLTEGCQETSCTPAAVSSRRTACSVAADAKSSCTTTCALLPSRTPSAA